MLKVDFLSEGLKLIFQISPALKGFAELGLNFSFYAGKNETFDSPPGSTRSAQCGVVMMKDAV